MSNKKIDIDSDFSSAGKEVIENYIKEKYGKENFCRVGTFSTLGPASAAKDLMRFKKVSFAESVKFTAELDKDLSWADNIEKIKATSPHMYNLYLKHKDVLDLTPNFINKIRQVGSHAGGILITPEPIYNYIPVERVQGEIVSAFPESGAETELDEIGLTKLDILAISILDVVDSTIDMIEEKLYLIEEDGIKKIVPESYLDKELVRI